MAGVCPAVAQYNYPATLQDTAKVEKFGHSINDPYRWLEDLDSKQTKDWLAAQGELIHKYRNATFREYTIVQRDLAFSFFENMEENYESNKIGAYYFSPKQVGETDNSPSLYYKTKKKNPYVKLMSIAPYLKGENDAVNVSGISVSENDSLIAVAVSHNGSDWKEIHVVDAETKAVLKDEVNWTKETVIWGGKGFFYQQYEKESGPNEVLALVKNSAIYYHKIGTNPAEDIELTPRNNNEKHFYSVQNGKFLILFEQREISGKKIGTLSYLKTDRVGLDTVTAFLMQPNLTSRHIDIIGESNGMFIAKSNYKSPKGKIMAYDYSKINQGRQLVEQFNQNMLSAHYLKDKMICIYMDKGNNICLAFDSTGNFLKSIELPKACSIDGFNKVYQDSIVYYHVNTFTSPSITLKFNLNTLTSALPEEDAELSLGSVNTTEIVTYKSKDSTDIYMYVIHNNKLKLNSNTPVLIYAYGGFGIAERPGFNFMYNMLLQKGVVIAIPLIRGGGEFGADWHNAGRKQNKQNSVDDVVAATQWLIDNKYTNPEKIAITGGSQGGWLMAETMVQQPQLYKAVVPIAGVYDLLRFHLFSRTGAIGYDEFGNPEDSTEFEYLTKISPYHQIREGVNYPACMVFTGTHDDRVVPFHSYKLLASLQKNGNPENPYLLYLEENAGHNVSSTNEGVQQISLMYTFILKMLGVSIF